MNIRRATTHDAELLAQLSIRTFTETFGAMYPPEDLEFFLADSYSVDRQRAILADPDSAVWFLMDGDDAVGYVNVGPCGLPHVDVKPDDGEVKRLYIVQSHQGNGAGVELMQTAVDWLLREGPRVLWLGVWSENYGAQRFYQRFGFEPAGEYKFKVGGSRDHEFIYRRPAKLSR